MGAQILVRPFSMFNVFDHRNIDDGRTEQGHGDSTCNTSQSFVFRKFFQSHYWMPFVSKRDARIDILIDQADDKLLSSGIQSRTAIYHHIVF